MALSGTRARWLTAAAFTVAITGTAAMASRPDGEVAGAAADTAVVSRSIVWLETRLDRDPGNTEVASRLAARYVLRFGTGADLGDVRRAELLTRRMVDAGTGGAAALARLSGILLMQHDFSGALAAAEKALEADPANADALGAFADAALAAGRMAEGRATLERLPPRALGTLVRRAQWLEASGNGAGAYALMDRVCRKLARSSARPQVIAWCLTELARSARATIGPDAARGVYERAARTLPGYRAALEGLAGLDLERGDWRAAERRLRRILSDAHPDLYLRMAEVAAGRGEAADQQRWEAEFLRIAAVPANEALYGHPLALYLAGRNDDASRGRAVAIAEREVARRQTVDSWDLLAWCRHRAENPDGARAAVLKASGLGVASAAMAPYRAQLLEAFRAARRA
jgi:tetratricopeptide (TPR) repeat protein